MKSKLRAALVVSCITAATPFMGLPALGAACLDTPATQTLGGLVNFNLVGGGTSTICTAGNVTFSNVVVNTPIADQGGSVVLGDFIPVSPAPGFAGLELHYTGIAPNVQNATVEVSWTYNVDVSAPLLITQALLGLHDIGVGGGQSTAIETLSNGITLRLEYSRINHTKCERREFALRADGPNRFCWGAQPRRRYPELTPSARPARSPAPSPVLACPA
jgi:hypothetical protein